MTQSSPNPPAILVAEDEDSVRLLLERALGAVGYRVVVVADGAEALAALTADTFDLLLTDIRMPRVDGVTLALKAAKDFPEMRVMMMTGFADEAQRVHGLDVLSHEVISKPFALPTLLGLVASVLARK